MKIRSTGLGKTLMVADFVSITPSNIKPETLEPSNEPELTRLKIEVAATAPVHWTIRIFAEPQDIRKMVRLLLKPSVLCYALTSLLNIRRRERVEIPQGTEEAALRGKT
jgi:hypothetical protein